MPEGYPRHPRPTADVVPSVRDNKHLGVILLAVAGLLLCVAAAIYLLAVAPIQEFDRTGQHLVGRSEEAVVRELGEPWRTYHARDANALDPANYMLPPLWPPQHKALLYRKLNFLLILYLDEDGMVSSAVTVKQVRGF
jgi:hypothetical protein